MRKQTESAVNAFNNGKPFKGTNTKVTSDGVSVGMYLFDNLIAYKSGNELSISSCGWNTATTKERLNGLLRSNNLPILSQSNFEWFIGDKPFNGRATFKLKS